MNAEWRECPFCKGVVEIDARGRLKPHGNSPAVPNPPRAPNDVDASAKELQLLRADLMEAQGYIELIERERGAMKANIQRLGQRINTLERALADIDLKATTISSLVEQAVSS